VQHCPCRCLAAYVTTRVALRIHVDGASHVRILQKRAVAAARKAGTAKNEAASAEKRGASGAHTAWLLGRPRTVSGATAAQPAATVVTPFAGQKQSTTSEVISSVKSDAASSDTRRIGRKQPVLNVVE